MIFEGCKDADLDIMVSQINQRFQWCIDDVYLWVPWKVFILYYKTELRPFQTMIAQNWQGHLHINGM